MTLLTLFLRRSKRCLCVATLCGLVSGLSTTELIVMVNGMINRRQHSAAIIFTFAAVCIFRLLSGVVAHALLVRLSQQAVHDLRIELSRKIIDAPLRQLEQIRASRLTSAFADDLLPVTSAVINLPYFFVNGIVLAGCLVYLGWLSWHLLIGIGTCIVLGASTYTLAIRKANSLLRRARQDQDQLAHYFQKLILGVKELKLHAAKRREFMTAWLEPSAERACRNSTGGITVYSAAANLGRLLFFVYVGLLILWPWGHRSAAELTTCVIVILYMMTPLEAILNAMPVMAQAKVGLQQIESLIGLLGCENGKSPFVAQIAQGTVRHELSLIDICYTYKDGSDALPFMLGPINLVLRPGEITFVIGGNGSGKTTLGKLITGLYRPESGEVRLDGKSLDGADPQELRSFFAAVFNDFCVFDQPMGIDSTNSNQLDHYLQTLNLDHKVRVVGGRFSTTDLSQGQRKRLALLAALLEDRPIYLFDEWAADQDPEFKEAFYRQIVPDLIRRGKSVVVITHDDRYFDIADQMVRLEEGMAVAVGRSDHRGPTASSIEDKCGQQSLERSFLQC